MELRHILRPLAVFLCSAFVLGSCASASHRRASSSAASATRAAPARPATQPIADTRPDTVAELAELGASLFAAERFREAEQAYRQALTLAERTSSESEDVAAILNQIGRLLCEQGRDQEAVTILKRALTIDDRLGRDAAEDHRMIHLENLAIAYGNLGLHDQEAEILEKALDANIARWGAESEAVSTTRANLGLALRDAGRLDEAEEMLRETWRILRALHGPTDATLVTPLVTLGGVRWLAGDDLEAESLYRMALTIGESAHLPEVRLVVAIAALGEVSAELGDPNEALGWLNRAIVILERDRGMEHPEVMRTLIKRSAVYLTLGRPELARADQDRAMMISAAHYGERSEQNASVLDWISGVLEDAGRYDEAEAMSAKAQVARGEPSR